MSHSFFSQRKDAVFAAGSNNFSTKISATPLAFGLNAGQASNYAILNGTFQAAYRASLDPATRTRGNIQAKRDSLVPLRQSASALAKIISGTPTVTDTQKIELGLAVRAAPTPMGPLGTPTDFKVGIDLASGALNLTWKNTNPRGASGATYQIWRQIAPPGGTGQFEYLSGVGAKKYTDDSVPAGTAQVQYRIQAVRSTSVGPLALFIVNFGAGGSGAMRVTETGPIKMAA